MTESLGVFDQGLPCLALLPTPGARALPGHLAGSAVLTARPCLGFADDGNTEVIIRIKLT